MKPLDSAELEGVTGGNFESYAMIFLRALADTMNVASGRGYDPNYGYGYNYGNYGYANNGYPYQDPRYGRYGYQYGYQYGYPQNYGYAPRGQMSMEA